jgi:hypothetical protein
MNLKNEVRVMFKILTKEGTLQVNDAVIRLVMPFQKTSVWEMPTSQVMKLVRQPEGFATNVVVHSSEQPQRVLNGMPGKKADELFKLFPGVEQVVMPLALHWYQDIRLLARVVTYTKEAEANREVAEAEKYGWQVGDLSTTAGHVNVGRTATAAVLTGGVSLLLGASRSKDKLTIAFARESDWLERYKG